MKRNLIGHRSMLRMGTTFLLASGLAGACGGSDEGGSGDGDGDGDGDVVGDGDGDVVGDGDGDTPGDGDGDTPGDGDGDTPGDGDGDTPGDGDGDVVGDGDGDVVGDGDGDVPPPEPVCGDGAIEGDEECDDDNEDNGDGCDQTCELEPGYGCAGEPSSCAVTCGDGTLVFRQHEDLGLGGIGGETGFEVPVEAAAGASGIGMGGAPSIGRPDIVDECDDNNMSSLDGCSDTCGIEPGYCCEGAPSECIKPRFQFYRSSYAVDMSGLDNQYGGDHDLTTMACIGVRAAAPTDCNLEEATVGDLDVVVEMSHSWVGDLTVKVISPSGTQLDVLARPGHPTSSFGDSSDLSIDYPIRYDDDALLSGEQMGNTIGAAGVVCRDDNQCTFIPSSEGGAGTALSDFIGEPIQGDWWVCIGDSAGGDVGILDGMRIEVLPE